ncbi:MAG: hypothetical protein HQL53_12400 [Magnetococcales bacterium]|nr:hypothetical protein [Magnetococcales bacterium]
MKTLPDTLPEDPAALRAMIVSMGKAWAGERESWAGERESWAGERESWAGERTALTAEKESLQRHADLLQEQVRLLLSRRFGRSSEKGFDHPRAC